ncbi:hypothetical protein ONZ45_g9952 [Pleurotus djamor]|nr:hypothetical protein ONZ45_g9952 [Pleurotus djamor]
MHVYPGHAAQAAIDDEIDACKKRIQTLLKQRNTYAAVSKLPNEIIAHIFNTCHAATAQSPTSHTATRLLLSISAVCSHWRHIALGSAQLWARISLDQAPSWATTMVQRSKSAPLTVDCPPRAYHSNPRLNALLTVLAAETHRFEKLFLYADRAGILSMVSRFLSPNDDPRAPLLRSLSLEAQIQGQHILEPPYMISRLWTDLRSLRTLRLHGVLLMDVAIPHMPVLARLEIYAERAGHRLSISWAVTLLRQTPLVEHVHIGTISSGDDETAMTDPHPNPIHLPHLVHLTLLFEYFKESKLLTYLRFPNSTCVHLSYDNEEDDPSLQVDINPATPHRDLPTQPLELLISHIISPNSMPIDVEMAISNIGGGTAEYELAVQSQSGADTTHSLFSLIIERFPWSMRQHTNLAGSLPLDKIRNLSIFGLENGDISAWSYILPSLIHLESISLDRVTILRSLAIPDPAVPSSEPDYYDYDPDPACLSNPDFVTIDVYEDLTVPDKGTMVDEIIQVWQRRNRVGGPIVHVNIHDPHVPSEELERLAAYARVDWYQAEEVAGI